MFSVVEYAAWTVVLLYAFDQGGAGLAGFVAVAQLLPAALVAPALAPLVERPSRSAALAGAYLGIGALLAAMALSMGRQFTATIALAVLSTIVMSVARPLHYSALPQLAPDPRTLVSATAASGLADGVGVFLGPVLAGAVGQRVGLAAVPTVCSVSMVGAAALVASLRLPTTPVCGEDQPEGLGSILATLRHVGETSR